jgi:protocatechuate 3,4-dioxygenase beta subunit
VPYVIRGAVLDTDHNPVAQARVFFVGGPAAVPDVAALTDDQGEFALSVSVPGTYEIECAADGFAPTVATAEVGEPQEIRLRVRLARQ